MQFWAYPSFECAITLENMFGWFTITAVSGKAPVGFISSSILQQFAHQQYIFGVFYEFEVL